MDIYKFHKLALGPFLQQQDPLAAVMDLSSTEKEQLVHFIQVNGLAVMWHQFLKSRRSAAAFPQKLLNRLEGLSMEIVASYLIQKYVLDRIAAIFKEESIDYAIFKGAHIREILYDQPSVRPACDIDVLIYPSDMTSAVKTLVDSGFTLEVKQQNISHEVTLVFRNVAVDLHWHILRPGRLRTSLTDEFLARRHDYGTHIGFDVETTLFIMLVHPVFTKYSTTSLASLVRFVDLLLWVKQKQQPVNWDNLLTLLRRYGVCTAAWITTVYLHRVTGESLPDDFIRQIRPSPLKRHYLQNWINSNRAGKMYSYPLLIQLAFTLPAHDTIFDAVRFLRVVSAEKKESHAKTEDLLAAIEKNPVEKETETQKVCSSRSR